LADDSYDEEEQDTSSPKGDHDIAPAEVIRR
jgi:hypothetical protein